MTDMNEWNRQVIAEFRANGGRVEQFGELPLVILHTIGARSGQVREIPLVAAVDGDELTVFGSAAGAPKHPAWVHNLRAHPQIEVEFGTERYRADVTELAESERANRLTAMGRAVPMFADYVEKAAPRKIPAFAIRRT